MAPGHFRYTCEPAAWIIRRMGGVRALARALGVSPEAVSKCNRPADRGGTAGRMPRAWWPKLTALAITRGLPVEVVRTRLRVSERPPTKRIQKDNAVHASKRKGDRFERQVVDDLMAAGLKAHRVPLSGAVAGYHGDVRVDAADGRMWVVQCKITTNRRNAAGRDGGAAGRGAIVRFLSQVSFGLVEAGGVTYLAMRRDVFVAMLCGTSPSAVNVPRLVTARAKGVADAIAGHDALVFRRDQAREWMALVREDRK